jgi:sporulation protein YlmC with PRC-barrel domain
LEVRGGIVCKTKLVVLLLAVVGVPILGACTGIEANAKASSPEASVGATGLSGYELDSPAGDELGKVQDVLVDTETGSVRYLLVSFKDPLVFDKVAMTMNPNRLIPIPWALVMPGLRHGTLVLDAGESELVQAPYLDRGPGVLSIQLEQQIDAYWKR